MMTTWTYDLGVVAEVAHADRLPEPVILIRESGKRYTYLVACRTDADAAAWELALAEVTAREPYAVYGRLGGAVVKIATVEDVWLEHVGSALLNLAGKAARA